VQGGTYKAGYTTTCGMSLYYSIYDEGGDGGNTGHDYVSVLDYMVADSAICSWPWATVSVER
jgi:hypothetical protein